MKKSLFSLCAIALVLGAGNAQAAYKAIEIDAKQELRLTVPKSQVEKVKVFFQQVSEENGQPVEQTQDATLKSGESITVEVAKLPPSENDGDLDDISDNVGYKASPFYFSAARVEGHFILTITVPQEENIISLSTVEQELNVENPTSTVIDLSAPESSLTLTSKPSDPQGELTNDANVALQTVDEDLIYFQSTGENLQIRLVTIDDGSGNGDDGSDENSGGCSLSTAATSSSGFNFAAFSALITAASLRWMRKRQG